MYTLFKLPKSTKITFKKNKLPTKLTSPKPKPTPKRKLEIEEEELGSIRKRRRRSARIQGKVSFYNYNCYFK